MCWTGFRRGPEGLDHAIRTIRGRTDMPDRLAGIIGGYLRWTGMILDIPQATQVVEKITNRQLETLGRSLVQMATEL